jgi:hypothetical protein
MNADERDRKIVPSAMGFCLANFAAFGVKKLARVASVAVRMGCLESAESAAKKWQLDVCVCAQS